MGTAFVQLWAFYVAGGERFWDRSRAGFAHGSFTSSFWVTLAILIILFWHLSMAFLLAQQASGLGYFLEYLWLKLPLFACKQYLPRCIFHHPPLKIDWACYFLFGWIGSQELGFYCLLLHLLYVAVLIPLNTFRVMVCIESVWVCVSWPLSVPIFFKSTLTWSSLEFGHQ